MADPKRIWTAALIVIGDEILSGRTLDKNIAQIASWLQVQGIRLAEVRVVPDVEDRIVEAVNALRMRNDYLFTTGGIGPTHDDITVDAIARALGVPVKLYRVSDYAGLVEALRANDWFMVLNDFESYRQAQRRIDSLWAEQGKWWRMSVTNTAHCGWFSADRAIGEYAERIWHVPTSPDTTAGG